MWRKSQGMTSVQMVVWVTCYSDVWIWMCRTALVDKGNTWNVTCGARSLLEAVQRSEGSRWGRGPHPSSSAKQSGSLCRRRHVSVTATPATSKSLPLPDPRLFFFLMLKQLRSTVVRGKGARPYLGAWGQLCKYAVHLLLLATPSFYRTRYFTAGPHWFRTTSPSGLDTAALITRSLGDTMMVTRTADVHVFSSSLPPPPQHTQRLSLSRSYTQIAGLLRRT